MPHDPLPDPANLPPDGGEGFNRLVFATSPYLRQHARNPVDWYPWSPEALEHARREDRLIFLSVGYASCHWCHVMAEECFADADVAAALARDYISIKVDREERPDLDQLYMTATQLVTGRGGWPNSVFLLPDGRPFFAGTYFPKNDRGTMPGFLTVLRQLNHLWTTDRARVEEAAEQLAEGVRRASRPAGSAELPAAPDRTVVNRLLAGLMEDYDAEYAGFGDAPKFPPHRELDVLLMESARHRNPDVDRITRGTLDAMALGGLHDHIGGGFHRYCTDREWFLPHFEKMLYDNAQLGRAYSRAAAVYDAPCYADVARRLLDWCLRDLQHPDGGFYSAWDAGGPGEEGVYYLWRRPEILGILEEEGPAFADAYAITPEGTYYEEATGRRTPDSIPQLAAWPEASEAERLSALRERLRTVRDRRTPPECDDKVVAAWNGLMIGTLAVAARDLGDQRYREAAERTAAWLLDHMLVDGRMHRTWRDGVLGGPGYLEDYALVAGGLLDLYETTGTDRWRAVAADLMETVHLRFRDPDADGYFFTADDAEALLVRSKEVFDQSTPGSNGAAALVMARLANSARDADETRHWAERSVAVLRGFSGVLGQLPRAVASLVECVAILADAGLLPEEWPPAPVPPGTCSDDGCALPTDPAD